MNKSIYDRIMLADRAGRVTRFHTCDLIKPQTDGTHTYNVLNILCILFDGDISVELMQKALLHDQGERRMGDMPGNVKREMPDSSWFAIKEFGAIKEIHPYAATEIEPWEYDVLKLADNLDGLITCTRELIMGNLEIAEAGRNYANYVEDDLVVCEGVLSEAAQQAVKIFIRDWSEAYGH